jgi:two-component system response regulator YesN
VRIIFRVIIIDDEAIIRHGISNYIKILRLDFDVVATFDDGKEAIEYLKNNDVDVVVTDIRMTEVSGIDVIQFVHNFKPHAKIIVISGYKDFEYTKAAIENNVMYYLTKPTRLKDISLVFQKIKEKLLEENQVRLEQKQHKELLRYTKHKFYIDIFENKLDDYQSKIDYITPFENLKDSVFVLSEMKITNYSSYISNAWQYTHDGLISAINNLVQMCDSQNALEHYLIKQEEDTLLYLSSCDANYDPIKLEQQIRSFYDELIQHCHSILKVYLTIRQVSKYYGLNELLQMHTNETKTNNIGNSSEDHIILIAKEYIEKNFEKDLTLSEVSNVVMLNPDYFSRFFKQKTGQNFVDYLANVRIKKAIGLLKAGNHKIYEISNMVGYRSSKYFAKIFRQTTGCSPKEYRRKCLHEDKAKDE